MVKRVPNNIMAPYAVEMRILEKEYDFDSSTESSTFSPGGPGNVELTHGILEEDSMYETATQGDGTTLGESAARGEDSGCCQPSQPNLIISVRSL